MGDEDCEAIRTAIPGPQSLQLATELRHFEAREVTFLSHEFPVFWASAAGSTVTDVDGNRYLDLSSAFGVAAVGHSNPRVVAAVTQQAGRLLHGMGDVHPTALRAELLARLAKLAPGNLSHGYLGLNGGDAVEFARKTALLSTGRPGALVFEGAYHGLSYGTLELSGLPRFCEPFAAQLHGPTSVVAYPTEGTVTLAAALHSVERALTEHPEIGMIVVEPIAGRAGTLVPVEGFLAGLRALADRFGAILVFDEIYTGFGRTGAWFVCSDEGVVPDILCLGKAIAGGLPLSVALGTPAVMNAWPASSGEALHTATFLGNPLACAAALAVLDEIETQQLPQRAKTLGNKLGEDLHALAARLTGVFGSPITARGRGMMWALDLGDANRATQAVYAALRLGLIILQQGLRGTAIALTPPLVIGEQQLERAMSLLEQAILSTTGNPTQAKNRGL